MSVASYQLKLLNYIRALCVVFLLFFAVVFAQNAGTRYPVFDVKPDARIQGLGGASVTLEQHLSAVLENPAIAGTLKGHCISSTYARMFLDEKLYSATYGYGSMLDGWGLTVSWSQLASEKTPRTTLIYDSSGQKTLDMNGNFLYDTLPAYNDISNAILFSASLETIEQLYVGMTGKMLIRSLLDTMEYGAGIDLGLYASFMRSKIRTGLTLKDAVPVRISGHDSTESERYLSFGASTVLFNYKLLLTAQVENALHNAFDKEGSLGIEWHLFEPLVLRAGANSELYSFGASILLQALIINYTVVAHRTFSLDNPHRITIEYYFGGKNTL